MCPGLTPKPKLFAWHVLWSMSLPSCLPLLVPRTPAGSLEMSSGGSFQPVLSPSLYRYPSGQWGLISGTVSTGFSWGHAHTGASSSRPFGCHSSDPATTKPKLPAGLSEGLLPASTLTGGFRQQPRCMAGRLARAWPCCPWLPPPIPQRRKMLMGTQRPLQKGQSPCFKEFCGTAILHKGFCQQ